MSDRVKLAREIAARTKPRFIDTIAREASKDLKALAQACAESKLEGIVSKLATSRYVSGRTKTWLKTKCFTESNFVVVGTDRDRKTGALRALLAYPDSDGLRYAGAAFIALSEDERAQFLAEVERLTTAWAAFKSSRWSDAKWCQPKLTVRVKQSSEQDASARHGERVIPAVSPLKLVEKAVRKEIRLRDQGAPSC